ncbi:PREDICTED: coiled-coil domain-containing protein 65-like [Polistes canadensis]|uniref:coiled-coil domain-containing protein 65-like n=1 Tax=Polistes canadensis TaxID=91411 RepID=UPI000718E5B5|nr:PREDICTED: coiled-coil domain-containing protein 65-like [Polistes canadensis]
MPPKRGRKLRWATAMTKEEKRKEALERQLTLKRQHLNREIEMGALNTIKYRQSWRELMMRAKMPIIKEDIETAWRTFDRIIDNKDHSIISMIYESKINETLNEADIENIAFKKKRNEDLSQLQSIIRFMQEQLDNLLSNTKSKTMSKPNHTNKYLKNIIKRGSRIFFLDTKNRRKIYDAAKEKDEKNQQIITQQYVRISVLSETISKFRDKVATHKANVNKDFKEIMDEQHFFYNSYWIMKNRLISEQKEDRIQLTTTTIEYKLTKNYLERLLKKVESLLSLLLICHKYETLDENIYSYTSYKESSPKKISTLFELQGSAEVG